MVRCAASYADRTQSVVGIAALYSVRKLCADDAFSIFLVSELELKIKGKNKTWKKNKKNERKRSKKKQKKGREQKKKIKEE